MQPSCEYIPKYTPHTDIQIPIERKRKTNMIKDTPSATDGAPCSIQIITPKFQDEKCLAAAKIIDRDIRD